MKRIYFTILVLVASVIAMQANPVSQQEARKKAITFMQKNGKQINNVPARVKGIKSSVTQAPFYVFNATGGQGFVIIAGDDNATDILGYTNQGSFDEDNLPDNFRYWMEETARQIEALGKAGNGNGMTTQELVIHAAIEPLIKTQWDQGNNDGVYNAKCPTINGERCLTGCVATAGAQILYPKIRNYHPIHD